uniref:VanZ-like domain-containing protein n=1 Tax=Phenylobacterium glaciei TaxID=2803784 RepID=A0A974P464_9CAUL|nr:hypothetical protein JKL49_04065 [Phenylobacterium glaciei]
MFLDRLPRPLRLALYAAATAFLLWLCLSPVDELPEITLWDKVEHAIAWFVLTAAGLLLSTAGPEPSPPSPSAWGPRWRSCRRPWALAAMATGVICSPTRSASRWPWRSTRSSSGCAADEAPALGGVRRFRHRPRAHR